MSNDMEIPCAELDDWLSVLKAYQRSAIRAFLETLPPEQAAERWLGATGSPNIVPFGGTRDTMPFWGSFKAEFRKFICDEEAYGEEKKALQRESPITKAFLISVVSAAIGAKMGYAATLLVPSVTVLLYTVGKIGIAAYCGGGQGSAGTGAASGPR